MAVIYGNPFFIPTLDFYPSRDKAFTVSNGVVKITSAVGPSPVFSRASGGTCIDENGNVIWGPENLIKYSDDLTGGSWGTLDGKVTIVSGITDPLGGTSAFKLRTNTTDESQKILRQVVSVTGPASIVRVWAKAAEITHLHMDVTDADPAVFDLNAGTVSSWYPATIEDGSNGWWICTLSAPLNSIIFVDFQLHNGSTTSYIGNAGDGLYLWHPQLSRSECDYIPTTSSVVFGPRFQYDPFSHECLGVLLEQEATNLMFPSSLFTDGAWQKYYATIDAAAGTNPDGTSSCLAITSTTSVFSIIRATLYPEINTTYTFSVFAKAGVGTGWLIMRNVSVKNSNNSNRAWFNLILGQVGTVQSDVTAKMEYYGNGWWRCIVVGTTDTNVVPAIDIGISDNDASDVATAGKSILIWGAQLEVGSDATSYIPTTTAPVTRSADICNITGSDFTSFYRRRLVGTIFCISRRDSSGTGIPYSINDGYTSDRINLAYRDSGANTFEIIKGNSALARFDYQMPLGEDVYTASAFTKDVRSFIINGIVVSPVINVSSNLPSVDRLAIGVENNNSLAQSINGTISRLRFWPAPLSNSTLQELTQPWTPLSLSPALWLSDTGSDPAIWEDLSGNDRHATQANASYQPPIIARGLNGRQVRRFDGTKTISTATIPIFGSAFLVGSRQDISAPFGETNYGGLGRGFFGYVGPNYSTFVNTWANGVLTDYASLPIASSIFAGVSVDDFAHPRTNEILRLGEGSPVYTNLIGDIAEILVFPYALTTTQRQTVERYLAAKWGITLS